MNFLKESKKILLGFAAVVMGAVCGAESLHAAVANVLGNPDFENDLGGTIATANWNSEAGRGIAVITGGAPSGNKYLELTPDGGGGGAFTFQTVTGVQEGDVVVTAGLGRAYPKGLVLGTVAHIDRRPSSGDATAQVKPAGRLGFLEDVLCLPPSPESPAS